jgi:transposase
MHRVADRPHSPAAIRIDLGAIFVSMELSKSTWLVTSLSPGGGEKMSKHAVRAGDVAGLMDRFSLLRKQAWARTGQDFRFIVIQEAGLDGFWIHCVLEREGIESHVVDPATSLNKLTVGQKSQVLNSVYEKEGWKAETITIVKGKPGVHGNDIY